MKKSNKPGRLNQSGDVSIIFIILIIILLALGAGFYVWQKNANKSTDNSNSSSSSQAESQPASEEKKVATKPEPKACKEPSSTAVENIKASITSGNTAALEGYMAAKVMVILAATEGIGEQTPAQAVKDVTDFIGNPTTTTWDFALPAATINGYKATSYNTYFPTGAVVGKSSEKKVISFSFDCDGKIKTVFEANNENLLQ